MERILTFCAILVFWFSGPVRAQVQTGDYRTLRATLSTLRRLLTLFTLFLDAAHPRVYIAFQQKK